jgi:hypothetical protein
VLHKAIPVSSILVCAIMFDQNSNHKRDV